MDFRKIGSHDDVVNDISFDFYGRRFATCSSDKNIRIWDLQDAQSSEGFKSAEILRAHHNAIWRLSWAHPEFGQLLASCSEDRSICIWEEQENITRRKDKSKKKSKKSNDEENDDDGDRNTGENNVFSGLNNGENEESLNKNEDISLHRDTISRGGQHWTCKATLSDSKKAVKDVKFAPRHLGLKLAAASADGFLRIYEATDVFSLNFWQLEDSIQVEQTMEFGKDSSNDMRTDAPADGVSQEALTAVNKAKELESAPANYSEHGLTCLSWNTCPFEPAKIAVGGYSMRAVIFTCENGKWREELQLGGHNSVVHDVAWAPAMGRSHHQIATASRENSFKVHTLKRLEGGKLEYGGTVDVEVSNNQAIWRVAWNATGTVLATSSEDGNLCLWRKNFVGDWKCVQEIPANNISSETSVFQRI